jgi:hypothetical protein
MHPFFTPKGGMGNVLILDRSPDNDESDDQDLSELEAAMHPLLKAVESKDIKAMAKAFSDAFQIADISPHEEYPHENDDEDLSESEE